MSGLYEDGVKAALDAFGLHRRMPDGPGHLGAERLARILQHEQPPASLPAARRTSHADRLNRPTLWGDSVPMDSGSMATQGYAGLGPFGGV